jgi:hypothetical protein
MTDSNRGVSVESRAAGVHWGLEHYGQRRRPAARVYQRPASGLVWPAGVALNFKDREVYTIDSVRNGMFAYFMPEFFAKPTH